MKEAIVGLVVALSCKIACDCDKRGLCNSVHILVICLILVFNMFKIFPIGHHIKSLEA